MFFSATNKEKLPRIFSLFFEFYTFIESFLSQHIPKCFKRFRRKLLKKRKVTEKEYNENTFVLFDITFLNIYNCFHVILSPTVNSFSHTHKKAVNNLF